MRVTELNELVLKLRLFVGDYSINRVEGSGDEFLQNGDGCFARNIFVNTCTCSIRDVDYADFDIFDGHGMVMNIERPDFHEKSTFRVCKMGQGRF